MEPATASRRNGCSIKSQYSQLKVRLNPPKYIDTDLMNVDIVPRSAAEPARPGGSIFSQSEIASPYTPQTKSNLCWGNKEYIAASPLGNIECIEEEARLPASIHNADS